MLDAVKELSKIKKELVTTDNIKNVIFKKLPGETTLLKPKDASIQKASMNQIYMLNELFNLKSVGGHKN